MKGDAGAGWGLIQGKRVAGKLLSNRGRTCRKTAGKSSENLWKTGVEPLENRRETTGKTVGKPPGNRREKPRFWVTFASLNKGPEWPGRASPASFFGPWGGLP